MPRSRCLFWFLAVLLICPSAFAQRSTTDVAMADALYREARDLMDQKKYDQACPKFEESHRLDPATGTLLNLAACHEAQGRLASAWREYGEAQLAARRDQREDRVRYAEERVKLLEPKLSKLAVVVPPEANVQGLEVRVDSGLVGTAAWGMLAPIDAGRHRIEVSAPGKKPWSNEVTVSGEADSVSVRVPVLEDAPVPPAAAAAALPPGPGAPAPPQSDSFELERPIPTSVYVTGGLTLGFVAVAAVTGSMYMSRKAEFNEANADPNRSAERDSLRDDALLPGLVSTIAAGAAVLGAGVTIFLYATRPTEKHPAVGTSARRAAAPIGTVGFRPQAGGGTLVLSGAL